MAHAEQQLTLADRARIQQRIEAIEQRTDAEVVCAVATESGRYDRAESLWGLTCGVLALLTAQKLAAMDGWGSPPSLSPGWQVLLIVGGFILGSVWASYWRGMRRLLVLQRERAAEVEKAAHQVFSRHGVGGTRHRGGVLIFLSLFERRLEILCDQTAAANLSPEQLEAFRDAVISRIREGRIADALLAGLDRAEEFLVTALPRQDEKAESLPNQVLVFHPRP